MLYAEAKSVREERSKQRYALQEFSHIRVSLVKGKNSWKIGSVESVSNHFTTAISREARGSISTIYKSLRRFIQGEEAFPELFDFCLSALSELNTAITERALVELYCQAKILAFLGYVEDKKMPVVDTNLFANIDKIASPALISQYRQAIDKATLHSQL